MQTHEILNPKIFIRPCLVLLYFVFRFIRLFSRLLQVCVGGVQFVNLNFCYLNTHLCYEFYALLQGLRLSQKWRLQAYCLDTSCYSTSLKFRCMNYHITRKQRKAYSVSNAWRKDKKRIRLIGPQNQTKSITGSRLSRHVICCN